MQKLKSTKIIALALAILLVFTTSPVGAAETQLTVESGQLTVEETATPAELDESEDEGEPATAGNFEDEDEPATPTDAATEGVLEDEQGEDEIATEGNLGDEEPPPENEAEPATPTDAEEPVAAPVLITGFAEHPYSDPDDPGTHYIVAEPGTAAEDLPLPDTLEATAEINGEETAYSVPVAEWVCAQTRDSTTWEIIDGAYDTNTQGTYLFAPVLALADNETLAGGVEPPTVEVVVPENVAVAPLAAYSVGDYRGLLNAIGNAPTDGSETVITVTQSFAAPYGLRMLEGQNIRITSSGGTFYSIVRATGFTDSLFNVFTGTLTLENIALDGGGINAPGNDAMVWVGFDGMFIMNSGATLRNNICTSASYGGGVQVSGGSFTMNGGTISGNTAITVGGGVSVAGGSFTMNGGTISGNTAGTEGGGVSVAGGSFTMTGGTISGNSAQTGGGVYRSAISTLTLGGNAKIYGATAGGNVFLPSPDTYITLGTGGDTPRSGMNVRVTKDDGDVIVNAGAQESHAAYFWADDATKSIAHDSVRLILVNADPSAKGYTFDSASGTLTVTGNNGATTAWQNDTAIGADPNVARAALKAVVIGPGVTVIGNNAFSGCTNLESVTFAEGSPLEGIGNMAFASIGITAITLPEGLQDIGEEAFASIQSLESIVIPSSVGNIDQHAFISCSALASVTFQSNSPPAIGNDAFSITASGGIVYPPEGGAGYTQDWLNEKFPITWSFAPDKTPPTLSDPMHTRTDDTAATVGFTTSEAGMAYYKVFEPGGDPGTPDSTPNGEGWTSLGMVEGTVSGNTIDITAGAWDVYIVAVDEAGNVSEPLKIEIPALDPYVSNMTELNSWLGKMDSHIDILIDANFSITRLITIPANKNVTIKSMAGGATYQLTRGAAGSLITVPATASLTLEDIVIDGDNKDNGAYKTDGGGSLVYVDGGSFEMKSGAKIQNNTYAVSSGKAGNGGGVFVGNNGTFRMTGGEIVENRGENSGGVSLYAGSFNMTGGKITGNAANVNGGGVYVFTGTLTLGGDASIVSNTADVAVNNVYLHDADDYITLGTDANAPATGMSVGVTKAADVNEGVFVQSDATQAMVDGEYFFADDETKMVKLVEVDKLQLVAKPPADTTKPTVVNVSPNTTGAPISGNIVITFSEAMRQDGAPTVKLNNSITLTGGSWTNSTTYTIPYSALYYYNEYTVNISGFQDAANNVMDADNSHSFTTLQAPISAVNVTGIDAPVTGGTAFDTIADGSVEYTAGAVTWSPALNGGKILGNTTYTATVVLTAKEGYRFASPVTTSQIGSVGAVVTDNNGTSITLSRTYTTAAATASSITVKTQPTKLSYTEGEQLALNGLSVTITYNDGTTRDVGFADFSMNTPAITFSPSGVTELTVADHNGKPVVISMSGVSDANTSNLTVTVAQPVNHAPTATPPTRTGDVAADGTYESGSLASWFEDEDGDALTYNATGGGGTLNKNNISTTGFTYTPAASEAGTNVALTVTATDPNSETATVTLTLTVAAAQAVNHAPTATQPARTGNVAADGTYESGSLAGWFNDEDGDALTYNATGGNGTLTTTNISTTGFTYTPAANEAGTDVALTVTATDGKSTSATVTLTLTVAAAQANQDDIDIAAAKALVVGEFPATDTQANIPTAAEAKTAVETIINGLDLNDVSFTVNPTGFAAAIAGTSTDTDGTNGVYTFTVTLSKGGGTNQTTGTLTLYITATAYNAPADTTPPTVTNVSITSNPAPVSGNIKITFNEAIGTIGKVRLSSLAALTGSAWSAGNTVFTIPYSGLAHSTSYTINISGFADTAGNVMSTNSSYSFTTAAASSGDTNTVIEVVGDDTPPVMGGTDLGGAISDEDEEIAVNGGSVEIKLIVDAIEPTNENEAAIEQEAGNKTVALYLDVSLLKTITGAGANNVANEAVTQTDEPITIVLSLPETLWGKASYSIIRIHSGVATTIKADYDATNHTLSFKTDRFSTYAIAYTDAANPPKPKPPSNPGNSGGSSGSDSGGSNGGSGGSYSGGGSASAPTATVWIETPAAGKLAATAKDNALDYARSTGAGKAGIRASSLLALQKSGLRYVHDTVADRAVQVRIYFDDPGLFTKDTLTSGYVKGAGVDRTLRIFGKWFSNNIRVVHFDQPDMWEQPVRVAAKVDLTDMDASNLFLYGYDREANKYKLLTSQIYKIDEKGYIHFITEFAGDIIISEGPLSKHSETEAGTTQYYIAWPNITPINPIEVGAAPIAMPPMSPMSLSIGAVVPQLTFDAGVAVQPLNVAETPVMQPAAMLTAPTALPAIEKTDYSLERWLSWALLFSSLLAAAVLWALLPRKNDKYVTVEEYRKNNR